MCCVILQMRDDTVGTGTAEGFWERWGLECGSIPCIRNINPSLAMHSLLLCTETTFSKRSFCHDRMSHRPLALLKIGNLEAHGKGSLSPLHSLVGAWVPVAARECQLSEQEHTVKLLERQWGFFFSGYFYKPPLRGQVTVCLTIILTHLWFSKHAWFPTASRSYKYALLIPNPWSFLGPPSHCGAGSGMQCSLPNTLSREHTVGSALDFFLAIQALIQITHPIHIDIYVYVPACACV